MDDLVPRIADEALSLLRDTLDPPQECEAGHDHTGSPCWKITQWGFGFGEERMKRWGGEAASVEIAVHEQLHSEI